jgi:hypothetical protein
VRKEWPGLPLPVSYRIPVANGCFAHGIAEGIDAFGAWQMNPPNCDHSGKANSMAWPSARTVELAEMLVVSVHAISLMCAESPKWHT